MLTKVNTNNLLIFKVQKWEEKFSAIKPVEQLA